jgi:uncharacterized membrane protein HdeD (DUF308 family)
MTFALARNWWSLVIRGIVCIALGILAFARPGITLGALVLLFGAYAFINGVVSFVGAMRAAGTGERWGALLLEAVLCILAAAAAILWPALTAVALVFIIAAWAILTGVAEIAAAVRMRRHIRNEWLLGLAGVVSILFGVAIAAAPIVGAVVIAVWFGVYAFIFGFVLLALGIRLRHWTHGVPGTSMPLPVH